MDLVEMNGEPATAEQLGALAFAGYGNFTSMQVRDHRVRGLDLHMERLRRDSLELFGREMGGERVLAYLRHATRTGPGDRSVQVNVFARDDPAVEAGHPVDTDILVRAGAPAPAMNSIVPAQPI